MSRKASWAGLGHCISLNRQLVASRTRWAAFAVVLCDSFVKALVLLALVPLSGSGLEPQAKDKVPGQLSPSLAVIPQNNLDPTRRTRTNPMIRYEAMVTEEKRRAT